MSRIKHLKTLPSKSHWLHIRPLAFFIHCSHETPSHSQPISLWCIWWSIHTRIFYTHSNCIFFFFFFLVASQLCKWCDCMLLLPRLINECTWKFAKILLWSTCGPPWTVSSSVKISVFIIFISGTVFSACLEVGFRRFLFLSESNGQTQIVTQFSTCMIEARHSLDSLDCFRRRQELQALLLLCLSFFCCFFF